MNPQGPVVTIVIPLFNGGPFVGETLRSVLAQTYQQFEVIVIDDGSTDDGPDVVRAHMSDPRISLVMRPHVGVAIARNHGAERASAASTYLLFLDADDTWQPATLEILVDTLRERPEAAGAFVLADYVGVDGGVRDEGDFPRHMRTREDLRDGRLVPRDPATDVNLEQIFLTNSVYPPSCLLVRRTAFEASGGFDPRFFGEDWEFVARLTRQGPIVPVDQVMVGYRRHSANASGNRARNIRGARQVWAAVFYDVSNSAGTSDRIRAIWRAHQARTASRKLAEARELAARGKLLSGLSRAADALAHAVLRRPLRSWLPSDRGSETR
jgi:glycosyltransferase involved in cell wall biosynthesis